MSIRRRLEGKVCIVTGAAGAAPKDASRDARTTYIDPYKVLQECAVTRTGLKV